MTWANKYPPVKTGGISFSGKTLKVTGNAQVRFRLACQPSIRYLLPINGLYKKPSSERKVARECVTEGACATDGKNSLYRGEKILLRVLPQSPSATAPSRREPFAQKHSALTFYLSSVYRHSLYWTTQSRGFRYTRKKPRHKIDVSAFVYI